tara:strand:- start:2592 stop:4217 length:1626 start_codon:yes stop_codon:yes gene_type:complete
MSLPAQWEYIELKDLLSFVLGGDWGKEATFSDDDYELAYCIRGTEFKNWKSEKGLTSVQRKIKKSSIEKRRLREGDILVEISGGGPEQPVGRTVLIDKKVLSNAPEYPKVCTNFIRLTRPSDKVDSRYLNYYLNYFYLTGEVINYQGGSNNLRNLKYKEYEKIRIPVAPLSGQVEIADKLDTIMEKVEMAQSRLDKIPTLLKRFRMSVLSAAVSGELTEEWRELNNAEEWEHVSLKEVGKAFNYGTSSKSQKEGDIPVLRMGNLQNGEIDWGDLVYTSDPDEIEKYKLQPGDVLFNRTNSPELVGKTSIYRGETEAIYAGYLIKVQGTKRLRSEYLNIQLNSPHARDYCWKVKTDGVSQSNINAKKLQAYEFELPSVEEQDEVIRIVSELLSKSAIVSKQYQAAKLRFDRLSQSILARAFRGELFDPFSDKPRNEPIEATKVDEQPYSTAVEDVVEPTEPPTKTSGSSTKRTPIVDDKSPIFQLLKKNKNGMTAQQLFADIADNTFSAIDELFVELKRLLESELITKVGEGSDCSFKVGKK